MEEREVFLNPLSQNSEIFDSSPIGRAKGRCRAGGRLWVRGKAERQSLRLPIRADSCLRATRSRLWLSTGQPFTTATALRLPFTQGSLGALPRQCDNELNCGRMQRERAINDRPYIHDGKCCEFAGNQWECAMFYRAGGGTPPLREDGGLGGFADGWCGYGRLCCTPHQSKIR